jgi:hypothetical protein
MKGIFSFPAALAGFSSASWAKIACTPIGATNIGAGWVTPKIVVCISSFDEILRQRGIEAF